MSVIICDQLVIERLGLVPYSEAHGLQRQIHAEVVRGERPPTLLLLEHPRTITLGQSANRSHLLFPEDYYQQHGVALHLTERGGNATYHGPGQLVGYPIVPVQVRVGDYLRCLEAVLIDVLASYGVPARGNPGYAGIFTTPAAGQSEKIAAIGIAVRSRVAFHGFALNVAPDLNDFSLIVPCGMAGQPVTSMEKFLADRPQMNDVLEKVAKTFQYHWARLADEP